MWEEEPRWQEAQFRLLVAGVAVFLVVTIGYGLFVRDWEFLKAVGTLFGGGAAMLVGYAAIVRLIGELCRRRWGQKEAEKVEPGQPPPSANS